MNKWMAGLAAVVLLGATGAMANERCINDSCGKGGSGAAGTGSESSTTTIIVPQQQPAQQNVYGGSGVSEGTAATAPVSADQYTYKEHRKEKADLTGVQVQIGGGLEGYTGRYAGEINPGPAWDGTLGIRPFKALGLELGYSGAANELDKRISPGNGPVNGADIVRNGGQVAAIISAPTTVAPYVMGGVGIDWYNFRGPNGAGGFRDDTAGNVPVGVGIRGTAGHFTADLRGTYNYPFSENFAPVSTNNIGSGRYGALLNVGGSF